MKCALIFNLTGWVRQNKKLFLGLAEVISPEKLMNLILLIQLLLDCDVFVVDDLVPLFLIEIVDFVVITCEFMSKFRRKLLQARKSAILNFSLLLIYNLNFKQLLNVKHFFVRLNQKSSQTSFLVSLNFNKIQLLFHTFTDAIKIK